MSAYMYAHREREAGCIIILSRCKNYSGVGSTLGRTREKMATRQGKRTNTEKSWPLHYYCSYLIFFAATE